MHYNNQGDNMNKQEMNQRIRIMMDDWGCSRAEAKIYIRKVEQ